jgi:hypothetical protein
MPDKRTIKRAEKDRRQGKSASTQAGEFVRDEIHKIRRGEHGARSTKQAIAIALSEARRAGVDLPPPQKGKASERTRRKAKQDYARGHGAAPKRKASAKRSRATLDALKREPRSSASRQALSRQAHSAAAKRTHAERSASARQAARTKGAAKRSAAARKAARTRARSA